MKTVLVNKRLKGEDVEIIVYRSNTLKDWMNTFDRNVTILLIAIISFLFFTAIYNLIKIELMRYWFKLQKREMNRTPIQVNATLDTSLTKWTIRIHDNETVYDSVAKLEIDKIGHITGRTVNHEGDFKVEGRVFGDKVYIKLVDEDNSIVNEMCLYIKGTRMLTGLWSVPGSFPFNHGNVSIYNDLIF